MTRMNRWTCCFVPVLVLAAMLLAGCASGVRPDDPVDTAWWHDPNAQPAKPQYEDVEYSSFYLPMRDGVVLAVDLYLPENIKPGKKLPTILLQTRYWRNMHIRWYLRPFFNRPEELDRIVSNGYAIVRLDARGSGASLGSRSCPWSEDEIKDGAEVVDWIIEQPWSSGVVGSVGGSYEGTAAELLLTNQHPAVKAVAPMFSLYDVYSDIAFPGGIHLEWFTRVWQKGNHAMDVNRPSEVYWWAPLATGGVMPVETDKDGSMLEAAIKDHQANYTVHDDAITLVHRDDVSPSGFSPDSFSPHAYREKLEASGAAIYSYSGWFDGGYAHAAIKRHMTLKNPGNRLTLGPWDHGGDDRMRPFRKPVKAKFDHAGELLRFFDHHLKGLDTGIDNEPPVHYYTMVEGAWKAADSWPPKAVNKSLYLSYGGELSEDIYAGETLTDAYRVDRSVGTGDRSRWNCLAKNVAVQYPDRIEQDGKSLVYTGRPLKRDIEVTGHPNLRLYLASDKQDAQIFVYLEDVDPEGRVNYVTEGMFRAMHRAIYDGEAPYQTPTIYRSFTKKNALPLTPGNPENLVFDLLPVSYLFKKGHRVRVSIAGADADHFRILPGDAPTFTVYRNRFHPSRIELPVVNQETGPFPAR
jgi:uncharacterized protein